MSSNIETIEWRLTFTKTEERVDDRKKTKKEQKKTCNGVDILSWKITVFYLHFVTNSKSTRKDSGIPQVYIHLRNQYSYYYDYYTSLSFLFSSRCSSHVYLVVLKTIEVSRPRIQLIERERKRKKKKRKEGKRRALGRRHLDQIGRKRESKRTAERHKPSTETQEQGKTGKQEKKSFSLTPSLSPSSLLVSSSSSPQLPSPTKRKREPRRNEKAIRKKSRPISLSSYLPIHPALSLARSWFRKKREMYGRREKKEEESRGQRDTNNNEERLPQTPPPAYHRHSVLFVSILFFREFSGIKREKTRIDPSTLPFFLRSFSPYQHFVSSFLFLQ